MRLWLYFNTKQVGEVCTKWHGVLFLDHNFLWVAHNNAILYSNHDWLSIY